ncbi:hypothetical protein FB567DRAFT_479748 [Paraphoma chrysanthemicola]|uniref:Glycoside hydrolase family 93 protein n=1 Tax=Paraphoma chrysanthemicola TaxID=798071 RepID=A0A8K0QXE6_9PLEO|nr:hypothetical protein FB567DRAFT_479748 [Paraphoma chrysanthemicola]
MRAISVFLLLVLFACAVKAQWDDPDWPDDPDDDDPDDDGPWRPSSTRGRPTPTRQSEDPPEPTPTGVETFANVTVYQPDDASHHLTSPRTENLPNNTILSVWNDLKQANNTLQVYRSTNNGFSWYAHGTVQSTVAGRKLLEPHLLFVEGSWSSETDVTLLAVNAVDEKSTNIELYASWDQGATWEFVHRIAEGGAVGAKAVGEPYMMFHDQRLTVYYSDGRDSQHAGKVSQQSAADMWDTWGTAIDVVAKIAPADQASAASAAKLPNNQYIIAFEASQSGNSSNVAVPVQYKIAASPENAGTELPLDVTTASGLKPQGAPFVTWSSLGGANGTIILSDSSSNSLFINQALGTGLWKVISTVAGRAYGREVRIVPDDKRALRITGGSEGKGRSSDVLVTIVDLEKALAAAA